MRFCVHIFKMKVLASVLFIIIEQITYRMLAQLSSLSLFRFQKSLDQKTSNLNKKLASSKSFFSKNDVHLSSWLCWASFKTKKRNLFSSMNKGILSLITQCNGVKPYHDYHSVQWWYFQKKIFPSKFIKHLVKTNNVQEISSRTLQISWPNCQLPWSCFKAAMITWLAKGKDISWISLCSKAINNGFGDVQSEAFSRIVLATRSSSFNLKGPAGSWIDANPSELSLIGVSRTHWI